MTNADLVRNGDWVVGLRLLPSLPSLSCLKYEVVLICWLIAVVVQYPYGRRFVVLRCTLTVEHYCSYQSLERRRCL